MSDLPTVARALPLVRSMRAVATDPNGDPASRDERGLLRAVAPPSRRTWASYESAATEPLPARSP